MIKPQEALQKLIDGNDRFVSQQKVQKATLLPDYLAETAKKQNPFAIIVGCSDSRVPVEIIFDQWIGDLFVVRTAGNIIQSTQMGSIEFAVEKFGTRLIVVMGHSNCGAVQAAIDNLHDPTPTLTFSIKTILDKITYSVKNYSTKPESVSISKAVRANISESVNNLRQGSEILKNYLKDESLQILGAEYSLESGKVEFFNDLGNE